MNSDKYQIHSASKLKRIMARKRLEKRNKKALIIFGAFLFILAYLFIGTQDACMQIDFSSPLCLN